MGLKTTPNSLILITSHLFNPNIRFTVNPINFSICFKRHLKNCIIQWLARLAYINKKVRQGYYDNELLNPEQHY